ncbi:MAG: AraC family transcriptional regulator [Clostridia bacterium]|nr:AraC family transcriptional regulator [Clostridia bacterium]
MEWIEAIQKAIDYIEAHLTDDLDTENIAGESHYSSFHFQRAFSILCGYTLGEYIRNRRLSAAGAELAEGKARVIDVAYKYGYESPDSFARAFQRFHGVTPSRARMDGAKLRSFSPMTINLHFEGGSMMDYRIETKPDMLLTGFKRRFTGDPNEKQDQDHYFACETRLEQYVLEGMSREHETTYAVLTNFDDEGYDFYFAAKLPHWALEDFDEDLGEFAKRYEHLSIPEGLYVVCETERCKFPTNLVDGLRKRLVTEWLPSSGYELRNAPEINVIHWPFEDGNEAVNNSHWCEIWLPIEKK